MSRLRSWSAGFVLSVILAAVASFGRATALGQEQGRGSPSAIGESARNSPIRALAELEGLGERWRSAMVDLGVAGMAVVVVRGDEVILLETFGVRDPEKNLPVTPDTIFYIASCTKSFTAMAVVALAEQGKIDLDASVKKYLPRFQIVDASLTESLTVRDLLAHAKGVDSGPIVFLDAFTGEITEDRYYRWLKDASASGSFRYTNVHYTLLGRIIEAVSGKLWKDYLAEQIYQPSGMRRATAYASKMYADADVAIPCDHVDGKIVAAGVRKTDRTMHAAGGMGASINDLARWLRLNINKGSIDGRRIISEAGAAAMQRVQAPGDPRAPTIPGHKRVGYGLGWFIGTFHDRPIFEHGGGYTGAAAHISILPEDKLGVAVISNTGGAHTDIIAADIYNRLLDKQTDDPLPRLKKLRKQRQERMKLETDRLGPNPAKEGGLSLAAEAYAGRYEHEDWGAVRLELQDSELVGTLGDLKLRFGSSGKDQFKIDASLGELMPGRFELDGAQVMAIIFHAPDVGEVRLSGKP